MTTADEARAINCYVRTMRRLQGDRMDSWSSSLWQITCNNTCTGSVNLYITPAGQVQDGNNNCPSYTNPSICAQTVRNRLREAGLRVCRSVVRQVPWWKSGVTSHSKNRQIWCCPRVGDALQYLMQLAATADTDCCFWFCPPFFRVTLFHVC